MTTSSIQPGHEPEPAHPTESKEERQKIFEIQWEINLIGTYISVSNKNGNIEHQLNGIKKGLESGESPETLVPQMNQLIDQINVGTPSDQALFPSFSLTSGGNESKAMAQYALSVEKYLNTAAQQGQIEWSEQMPLFDQTRTLIDHIGAIPVNESVNQLNDVIAAANQSLPLEFQLQALGSS